MNHSAFSLSEATLSPADFRTAAAILYDEARISLSDAKISLVQSRLARRLRQRGLTDFGSYLRLVAEDSVERTEMVNALTTNHTHFFREKHHFDHLEAEVMPDLIRLAEAGRPVRIWSAGCSSGEEVYSVAMTLAGKSRSSAKWLCKDVKLLATDLSAPVVSAVERATYPTMNADQVPLPYRAEWMSGGEPGEVRIAPELRAIVTARVLNLFAPWPFTRQFDVIFCRNVMIYFDEESRSQLEQRLLAQLKPGGTLYIGHSERLSAPAMAQTICCGQTIYQKREVA